MLVVSDATGRFSWSVQIAANGSIENGEPFYRLEEPEVGWKSGVRAVAEDSIGQVYFATPMGGQMCEANGRMAAVFNPPEHGGGSGGGVAGKKMGWGDVAGGGEGGRGAGKASGGWGGGGGGGS